MFALGGERTWYQRAVFYEVYVRGFFDATGDGQGDIRGVTAKLDYLEWLGIDCLWLLPFYASPWRDGGYDVSDYLSVHPAYGSVTDIEELLTQAHLRGIRVIADMVLNHTSDQHPWFLESKMSRDNPKADWYVWADDDNGYQSAPVIFVDSQSSNWTYSPEREQYYWHRFFAHQPDLNYENPQVQEAILQVMRYWLSLGFDGFRLDAAAYLFQEEGTRCENLPATHAFLKRIRSLVDAEFPEAVLLAEVNQPPVDVVNYFGNGDECHMCYHFPLMPRLFLSVKTESALPTAEALRQTPQIPSGCQWGIFLRNHDELTLEMVTEQEREFLYSAFASDPISRRNVGIGRRLAPLIDNDRRVAELLHALILSLPGAPILYYGDEILMGDNIYLGDRDSVRTPMQWSPDRNGGFSRADPARLYSSPIIDPVYGYQVVNVESQMNNPSSFLRWTREMLSVRHRESVLGDGDFELLSVDNDSVLAFARFLAQDERVVLCVVNFASRVQPVTVDLANWSGRVPVELLGMTPFPTIDTEGAYRLTLAPYGFLWFELCIA
ncbi:MULTISPECIES: maltose alpha-D-glucosyltransferase [Ferrimicrobium]|jgi:maltose alpha-D-glucosyltransferase/alpha-amylase|uniref:maltose alpha-D-glucosyltransferase n=1 Tax=Ferrimicrobium acidiphilum TaxID=121039 RepID=A0ABV3XY69_9ACTN|nr:maltose alpha-D-glucosyltransferase [Actinomycetota bacterium]